jgi:hypothetical protein
MYKSRQLLSSLFYQANQRILAGEGSVRERGLRPLSKFLPLSNRLTFYLVLFCCLRGGLRGRV